MSGLEFSGEWVPSTNFQPLAMPNDVAGCVTQCSGWLGWRWPSVSRRHQMYGLVARVMIFSPRIV